MVNTDQKIEETYDDELLEGCSVLHITGKKISEVLDLDAVTGGYNLQIAWSTAYLAAQAIQ